MPRTRPHQPAKAHSDQAYGVRGDQMAAQRAMPLPQTAAPKLNPAQPGAAVPAGGPPMAGPDILGLASQVRGGTPFTAPTTRPGEPVTTGLSIGPGAGPEAQADLFAMRRSQTADTLQDLADATGDPRMQELADRARMLAR